MARMTNLAVGADGGGSTLQAILDACETERLPARVALVFGNNPEARAFGRARQHGVDTLAIARAAYRDPDALTRELLGACAAREVGLICLAGFLRVLPAGVVREYRWRIMNSHPALLPFFGGHGWYGHHVHEGVLASGMKVGGCTIHFVSEEYDQGPIIVQRALDILDDDTPETFAARLLPLEHECYLEAIRLLCEGKLAVTDPPEWAARAKVWSGESGRRQHARRG